ncbi:MAG: hypothetical protein ACPG31_09860 [Planctomycetota bacterium]
MIIDLPQSGFPEEVLVGIPAHRILTVVLKGLELDPEEEKQGRSYLFLSSVGDTKPIYRFTFGDVRGSGARFERVLEEEGGPHWVSRIGIPYAGDYALKVSTPRGKMEIPNIRLDPMNLPSPLVMHLPQTNFSQGEIRGQATLPDGIHFSHWQAMAVPVQKAIAFEDLPEGFASWMTQKVASIQEDGSFHFKGLEPGLYRFGFRSSPSYASSNIPFLVQGVEASTGATDLRLGFPASWLSLDVEERREGLSGFEVRLELDAQAASGREPNRITGQKGPNGKLRWPLYPGGHYRLAVWGNGIPLFEKAWIQPVAPKDQVFSIPTSDEKMGRLGFYHHEYSISHEALSPKLGVRLATWHSLKRDTKTIALPPGEYLVISEGHSHYSCGGNIGKNRTPYGKLEEMVRVQPGETTLATGKPPFAGSLRIKLKALNEPNDALMAPFSYPVPEGITLTPFHFSGLKVGMILHPKNEASPIALSFTPKRNYGIPMGTLAPGDEETAHEVFLPGEYALEVRVLGYPRQWVDLKIEERRRTRITVELSNP